MSLAVKTARAASQGGIGPTRSVGAGDPGLFGALKGAVGGFLRGGPLGALGGAVSGYRSTPGERWGPQRQQVPQIQLPMPPAGGGRLVMNGARGPGQVVSPAGSLISCPAGTRPNKTAYYLKNGQFVDVGTRCVKIRRRNPLNPRALSRAISRIESGKRAAKRLSRISIRKSC